MAKKSKTATAMSDNAKERNDSPTAKSGNFVLPSDVEAIQSSENLTRGEAERHLRGENVDTIKGERVTFYNVVEARPVAGEHPLQQADEIQARNVEDARKALGADPVIVGPTATVMESPSDVRKVEEGDKAEGEPAVTVTL